MLIAPERDRPEVARFRRRWRTHQHRIDPDRLVFVDETGIRTDMTRTRGWCSRGAPLLARVPQGRWRTLTFMAGLRRGEVVARCVFDGPINGRSVTAWVEQGLVPILRPRDVVVDGAFTSAPKPISKLDQSRLPRQTAQCSDV